MPDKKIISLLPAATEIVCALGLKDNLVGRSHECDFPEDVISLPICSSSTINTSFSSAEIDQQVKDILTDAVSVYSLDRALIKKLEPDFLITQAQCEVCAVSLKDVQDCLQDELDNNVQIISLQPNNLEDVFEGILEIAGRLGISSVGQAFVDELRERCDLVHHKLKFAAERPRVLCVEWLEPLMAAGNWTPELIDIAGGSSLLSEAGKHSGYVSFSDIKKADPDIIVIAPCGFGIDRTLQEINVLLQIPAWKELSAVKNNKVFIADGNHYFNRSSHRIVDTIEILAEIIHPKQFVFGYEGKAWLKFNS